MEEINISEEEFGFEDFSNQNGITFWWASDFMLMLDYPSLTSFMKPIQRAMTACLTANIDIHENFIKETRIKDGHKIDDYKLSRFACYMIAMNGDVKKQKVAEAQTYFADQAQKINLLLEGTNDLERLLTREEVKEGNKLLNATAKSSGVENFAFFTDAGYRGLYNSSLKNLKIKKGLSQKQNLIDFMGRTELAANLFRITLTEEKLKTLGRIGEKGAIDVHKNVGGQVRKLVKDNTGKNPEELEIERKLSDVTKELKKANKKLNNQ